MHFLLFFLLFCLIPNRALLLQQCIKHHVIRESDNCYMIAKLYRLSVKDLVENNPGFSCQNLQHYYRKSICITRMSGKQVDSDGCFKYHRVSPGDTCWAISQKHGCSLEHVYQLNPRINCGHLRIGQIVCVSGGAYAKTNITVILSSTKQIPSIGGSYASVDLKHKLVTKAQFVKAVTTCGYPSPSDLKYQNFVSRASPDGAIKTKRELAMFLAQLLWESGGLLYLAEIACLQNGCPGQYQTLDDFPAQRYYGRGYIQLSWSYNYKAASKDLFGDLRLYTNPNQVANNDNIAWAVSFWYWKKNVHFQPGVAQGKFGVTTNAINGALECRGSYREKARKRFDLYKKVLIAFGLNETPVENGCYN